MSSLLFAISSIPRCSLDILGSRSSLRTLLRMYNRVLGSKLSYMGNVGNGDKFSLDRVIDVTNAQWAKMEFTLTKNGFGDEKVRQIILPLPKISKVKTPCTTPSQGRTTHHGFVGCTSVDMLPPTSYVVSTN